MDPKMTQKPKLENLLELPNELLRKCISQLNYEQIASARGACKTVDFHCQYLLNQGFAIAQRMRARCANDVKVQLPRRESERRTHPLARHADVLSSVETRISLLNMTYGKYIEKGLCCFIPGKVLDETLNILRLVERSVGTKEQPPRPHDLLQELRDISSMAMEYFDEHIQPKLPQRATSPFSMQCSESFLNFIATPRSLNTTRPTAEFDSLVNCSYLGLEKKQIRELKQQIVATNRKHAKSAERLKQQMRLQKTATTQLKNAVNRQQQVIDEMTRQYVELSRRVLDAENRFATGDSTRDSEKPPQARKRPAAVAGGYPADASTPKTRRQMPARKAARRE